MTEEETEEKSSFLEIVQDEPRIAAWIVLGLVSIVTLITQSDTEMIKYILGGCAALAGLTLFLD